MVVSQVMKDVKKTRYRLKEIKLEPGKSNYAISLRILVDGMEVYKLPPVKKRQPLCWVGLSLPCDLHPTSQIAVEVTEIHTLQDQVGSATCSASDVAGQHTISIDCNNKMFTVKITLLSREDATRAYSEAFSKVQEMEKPQGIMDKAGKVGLAFKALLSLGSAMADLDPTGGATVAFALCTKAVEHLEQQDKQDADLNKLIEDLAGMTPSVELVKDLANANLGETVVAMLNLIEDASLFILNYSSRSSWAQALHAIVDSSSQDKIQTFVANFEKLRKEFDTRVNVQVLEITQTDSRDSKLKKLKPAKMARYDPARACMPGTRVDITTDLTTWVLEPDAGQRLAWVQGLAGLGKSSIATSVCQKLDEHSILAASFFCKRDISELRDPRRVLTSIIYGLALRWKPYRDTVVAAMQADPELHTLHIQPLYEALANKLLQGIPEEKRPAGMLVVVVDALDECGDSDTRKQLLICLRGMSQLAPWLKIIVTSRPDPDIQDFFVQIDNKWFKEYNVLNYDALEDIRMLIPELLGNVTKINNWPKDAVEKLAHRSSGLFIWARTACKFITDGHNPCKRLEQVLSGSRLTNSTAELDVLYRTAIEIGALDGEEDNLADVLECLGVVVVTATRTPLSTTNLEKLLRGRISSYTLDHVIHSLSSVLYADLKQGGAIRVSHPSFMDYITDKSRSKELCIDLDQHNSMLARCCLEILMEELKFNICGLETSHIPNRHVLNLEARVQAEISPHLTYSCVYWPSHLINAQQEALGALLRVFLFDRKLLYWIEAMSLLEKLNIALSSLLELTRCLSDTVKDCRAYVYDVYRFVAAFYGAISESTPHLYISALGLAPEESDVVRLMRPFFPNRLAIVRGGDKSWTPCLSVWACESVSSVAFSPDSCRIVSGDYNNTLRIWDAETGKLILNPLKVHTNAVTSVAFSPNGRRIVSGSYDKTIRISDAETGEFIFDSLKGHSGWVKSVAFSPDGRHVVSGSEDETVRIWNAETGHLAIKPLEGHSDAVSSVVFSPDSRRIASGSHDNTIRIWDAETGQLVLRPLQGHTHIVFSVAFSPDSQLIVSGSEDNTVRIWNAKTGNLMRGPLKGHSGGVHSVAFSPNSRCIVSCSYDHTMRIWDATTGELLLNPLEGHSDTVTSASFSPNSRRIVSCSDDNTIRIWDVESSDSALRSLQGNPSPIQHAASIPGGQDVGLDSNSIATELGHLISELAQGHSGPVSSVAFSPNGRRIVSGSYDKTMRIWDAGTGKLVLEPLEEHSGSVAFSPDGQRIVSGSKGSTVQIWNVETGESILEPTKGESDVRSVAFSPDGRRIVSGSGDHMVRIWDAETGELVLEPLEGHSGTIRSVAFSSDGCRIVSGSHDKTVRIWDAGTGKLIVGPLEGHSNWVQCVAFSPDCRRVASGSNDSTMRIWDADTGKLTLAPINHLQFVCCVAFSPDGRRIASSSNDTTIRIWDVKTGELVLEPLRGHLNAVFSVSFSSDGQRIVSGSADGTVRIWNVEAYTTVIPLPDTVRYLPGTQIALLPAGVESGFVSSSFQLVRNINPDGWVIGDDGGLLLWLPSEFRRLDDSLICIPEVSSGRELVIDFSKFTHGNSWSSVACI